MGRYLLRRLLQFVPTVLAPLFAAGLGDRRPSSVARFLALLILVFAASVLAYLPDGGLREFWNATLGHQLSRESPFSLFGLYPSLEPLQVVVTMMAVGLAAACYFVPRKRDLRQVAALAGAIVIATQLATTHWFYFYIVWFLPFALVALLGAHERVSTGTGRIAGSTKALSA